MKRRTKADWEELVREYRNSGKGLRLWCEEKEINYKTMCGHTHLVPVHSMKRGEAEWINLIAEKQASGMSREGWCRERGVNPNSMMSAEKRLKAKLSSDKIDLVKEPSETAQKQSPINDSIINTDVTPATISRESGWIEVGKGAHQESEQSPKTSHITSIIPEFPFNDIGETIETKSEKTKMYDSKIMIRYGKLTIEADADYPLCHLEHLIGKLASVC